MLYQENIYIFKQNTESFKKKHRDFRSVIVLAWYASDYHVLGRCFEYYLLIVHVLPD